MNGGTLHLSQSLFFNKVEAFTLANMLTGDKDARNDVQTSKQASQDRPGVSLGSAEDATGIFVRSLSCRGRVLLF